MTHTYNMCVVQYIVDKVILAFAATQVLALHVREGVPVSRGRRSLRHRSGEGQPLVGLPSLVLASIGIDCCSC